MRARLLLMVLALLAARSAAAQFTSTITEVNPDRSTFDATDADGASGGRVNHLAVAADGITFLAASEWGGLFRSTDTGRTWAHLPGHVPTVTIDVAIDPTNASQAYATSLYDGRVASLSGINVSSDGGVTWTKPASATPAAGFCVDAARRDEPAAYGISINPADAQNVVVGTNCGVAISDDAGANWRFVDPTPGDAGATDVFDVIVHDGGIIDSCGADGHRRSTDGGTMWTTATSDPLPGGQCSLAVSPDEAYVLFATVGTSVFESDDAGDSWPLTMTNLDAQGRLPFVRTNQRTGAGFDLWFGDVGLRRETCTTPAPAVAGGARRCPNNAWSASFTRLAGGHDDVGDLTFAGGVANDGCPVLFASDGGVFFNTLNASPGCQSPAWEQPNVTPHALWLMGMGGVNEAGDLVEDLYFGAQDNGPFAATDAPASPPTWNNRECCDSFDIAADTTRALFTQCCFGGANRLRTSGVGMTGVAFVGNLPAGLLRGFRYTDIIRRFGTNSFVLVTTGGVFVTTNITATPIVWTQLGAATSPASPRSVELAISGGTTSFIVQAGVGDGRSQDQLFRFDGTGAGSWTQINPPGGRGGLGIFAVDPANPNHVIASHLQTGLDPSMVVTINGGVDWTPMAPLDDLMTGGGAFRYQNQRGLAHSGNAINQQMGYPQPTFVAFDREDPDVVVAGGADSGLFVSVDNAVTWTLVTDPSSPAVSGRPHIPRPRFAFFDHEGGSTSARRIDVYVGSAGRGVWRVRLSLPRVTVRSICFRHPEICEGMPRLFPERIVIDCAQRIIGEAVDCVRFDPIDQNCKVKYDCPGCGPNGLCPPFYQFGFDGLDPEVWEVGVVDRKQEPVPYEVARTKGGVVVSFQPEKGHKVEEYQLFFARKTGTPGKSYTFKARLNVGSGPYKEK